MQPLNLEKTSVEEFKKFLDSFDVVLSDCDGVLWHDHPIPGSGEFINTMKQLGKKCFFVSNNSLNSEQVYRKKFEICGIEQAYENLMVPSIAIVEYLKSINFEKKIFSMSCKATTQALVENGFKCVLGPTNLGEDTTITQLTSLIEDNLEIGAVVLDSDFSINMAKLWMAEVYLKRPEVHFICGAPDKSVPPKKNVLLMGLGYFVDILAERTKNTPLIIGKPGKIYAEQILKRFEIEDPSRVLFIGDTINQDMRFAKVAGFKSMFVLTSFSLEDALEDPSVAPDYYATTLGAVLPQFNVI